MGKVVVFHIDEGNFEQGFPVTLRIRKEGETVYREEEGYFPPAPDIPELYWKFQRNYNNLASVQNVISLESPPRAIIIDPNQITNFSTSVECKEIAQALQLRLKEWFRHPSLGQLRVYVEEELGKTESARIIFQTNNEILKKLPWHTWELFKNRRRAWFSLGARYAPPSQPLKKPVKILAILGGDKGIDTSTDENILKKLPGTRVKILNKPTQTQLCEILWEKPWDVLCFAGHSSSQDGGTDGVIQLSNIDSPALNDLRNAFTRAIENGLKLAIFNSCDGLGLANQLAELKIPQVIVMREIVPDEVAQKFLGEFLRLFSQGEPFYLAVRQAQEKLQFIENKYPCASWLPVISQNPAEPSLRWPETAVEKIKRRIQRFWRVRRVTSLAILAIISLLLILLSYVLISIPPGTPPSLSLDELFSRGERILITGKSNSSKIEGISAFARRDWDFAINKFIESLKKVPNDPETLIYLNNAIAMKRGNQLAIAIAVPIGESINVSEEILRGVAHSQSQFNCSSVDNLANAIKNNQPQICKGGVGNKPLLVEIVNDRNDSETAKKVAQEIVKAEKQQDILAVIGHYRSETTIQAVKEGYQHKIIVISPTSTSTTLDSYSVLRTSLSDRNAVINLSEYIKTKLVQQPIRATVLYNKDEAYSESIKDAFKLNISYLSPNINITNLGEHSVQEIVKKVQQENVNVLLLAPAGLEDNLTKALEIVKEVSNLENNPNLMLLGASTMYNPKTTSRDFGKASEKSKLLVAAPWFRSQPPSPFEQNAKKIWGQSKVNWLTAMTYDATQVIIKGLKEIKGQVNRQSLFTGIGSNVRNFSAEGATAEVRFEERGSRSTSKTSKDRLGILVKVKCENSLCNFVDEETQ
ncbi:MAG: ABC transporter substrate-binding protein [Cyanomargarita calcarea GSE-NOS-MK-12-04C]|jgi:branched-chain amino acid transport system substrate-binding protein|uniref:ABC transporter substrate-binding protein n=1 Tax=Cyanomargarita calcarea GSE-NOS-MK-12-04C TaxID=2839659 RepID=A0A951QNM9_9CYAN|nr:ABC transporter substrate-binding protein [Cyanomargarita calcarea GSE-NOS-MK-12-04C]